MSLPTAASEAVSALGANQARLPMLSNRTMEDGPHKIATDPGDGDLSGDQTDDA